MHFMKAGCNGKISQVSEIQKHLQTRSNLHILSVRTDSKNPVCHGGPCISTNHKIADQLKFKAVMLLVGRSIDGRIFVVLMYRV